MLRNESKKMKLFTLVIYVAFVVIYVGGSISSAKGNPAAVIPSLGMALIVGAAMFYTTSHHNQERLIWKKSGLKRLEKANNFPVVHLSLGEFGIVMNVPSENVTKEYRYNELSGILEIERLFLLEANDKTWQFVAKSAFGSREEMDEFMAFMEEKIADAKENPEKYEKIEETPEQPEEDSAEYSGNTPQAGGDGYASDSEEDAEEIEPVDTSNMGKIGKMAHIMAAMAANAEDEEEEEEEDAQAAGTKDAGTGPEAASDSAAVSGPEAEAVPEPEIVTAAEADHTDL